MREPQSCLTAMDNTQLPKYLCKKVVSAAKIVKTDPVPKTCKVVIHHNLAGVSPIITSDDWLVKYRPTMQDLGYYVRYNDGYESWSPSKAFEEGYDLIGEEDGDVHN